MRPVRAHQHGSEAETLYWNVQKGEIDQKGLEHAAPEAVMHIAGGSIYALRWTREKKQRIMESRVDGTILLSEALASAKSKPNVLLSASNSGMYGDHGNE